MITWRPASYEEAEKELANRVLEESHFLEFKQQLKGGKDGNKELAKDISAMALDGGTFAIGVKEDKETHTYSAAPVDLNGLGERIEEVVRYRVDPPLSVEFSQLELGDTGTGILLVQVPASPLAPHMADGRYYKREELTVRAMSDPEVRRLHSLQEDRADRTAAALASAVERARQRAHDISSTTGWLVVVAQPSRDRHSELLRKELADSQWWNWLGRQVDFAHHRIVEVVRQKPFLDELGVQDEVMFKTGRGAERTATGVRFIERSDGSSRHPRFSYLEVDESGAIRVAFNHVTFWNDQGSPVLIYPHLLSAVTFVSALLVENANEKGIGRSYGIGVHMEKIGNTLTYPPSRGGYVMFNDTRYREETYTQVSEATTVELEADPTLLLDRVAGQLIRSLGYGDRFAVAPPSSLDD